MDYRKDKEVDGPRGRLGVPESVSLPPPGGLLTPGPPLPTPSALSWRVGFPCPDHTHQYLPRVSQAQRGKGTSWDVRPCDWPALWADIRVTLGPSLCSWLSSLSFRTALSFPFALQTQVTLWHFGQCIYLYHLHIPGNSLEVVTVSAFTWK